MIDFHTHILPAMDDGAKTVRDSIRMLEAERSQGMEHVFLTPHFYADEDYPADFLRRRERFFRNLSDSLAGCSPEGANLPELHLGAEVYYFPGMSGCEELRQLALAGTHCILIEPPMSPWTETMLDEIEAVGTNLHLVPVIAHVDRYCRMLQDYSLFDRLQGRNVLNQVNASFFLHEDSKDFAAGLLENDEIHLFGSDCHDTSRRVPNLGTACRMLAAGGHADALNRALKRMNRLLI